MSVTYSSYPKATFNWSNTSLLNYVVINWTGSTTATSGTYTSGSIYSPTSTYTTGDLSFNTTYTFTLTPYNSSSIAGATTTMSINTTPKTSGIYATYSTSSTAQLQWYGSYSYVKVRRSHYKYVNGTLTQTGFGDLSAVAIANPYTDYDLSGNTTYIFYITPYLSGVAQSDSPQVSVKTNVQAPKDISVNSYDSSGIKLTFTTPKNTYSSTSYYTAMAVDSSTNTTITTTGTASPLWVVNLSGGTQYTCYVKVTLDSSSTLVATSASVVQTTKTSGTISSSGVSFVLLYGTLLIGVSGNYTLVQFTGNSIIKTGSTISSVPTILVGGGGGGGSNVTYGLTDYAGGGGAGGVGYGTLTFASGANHTITIGSGGYGYGTSVYGTNGSSTTIIGGGVYETAYGGGLGGYRIGYGTNGSSGGSGGGGSSGGSATKGASASTSGYSTIVYYGNAGGSGTSYASGGGAGAAGTNSTYAAGGAGIQWSYNLAYYGGGGGAMGGNGGNGGGGAGSSINGGYGSSGQSNTGGGGGPGRNVGSGGDAGNGGSGVVICAFTTSTTLLLIDDLSGLDYAGFYLSFENGVSTNDVSNNNNSNDIVFSYLNTPSTTTSTYAVGTNSLNLSSNSTSGGTQTTAPLIYSSNLNLTLTSSTYITISFWAKIASASSTNNVIISIFDGTAWSSSTGVQITCNSVSIFSRNTYSKGQSFTSIADNTWHHIAAIINFGTSGTDAITVYRDGSLVTNTLSSTSSSLYTIASAAGVSSLPYVTIGAQMNSLTYSTSTSSIAWATSGYLDDVRLFQYGLPYSTILQLYNVTKSSAKISSVSLSVGSTSVTFTISSSNTSYVVLKNNNTSSFSGPYSTSSGSTSVTISSLVSANNYIFVIYPFDNNGYQGGSYMTSFTTNTGSSYDVSGLTTSNYYVYSFKKTDVTYTYKFYNTSNTYISVLAVGGGGAGATYSGGGGGAGAVVKASYFSLPITGWETMSITVGTGGDPSTSSPSGGTSYVSFSLNSSYNIWAYGGGVGYNNGSTYDASGGSGGGASSLSSAGKVYSYSGYGTAYGNVGGNKNSGTGGGGGAGTAGGDGSSTYGGSGGTGIGHTDIVGIADYTTYSGYYWGGGGGGANGSSGGGSGGIGGGGGGGRYGSNSGGLGGGSAINSGSAASYERGGYGGTNTGGGGGGGGDYGGRGGNGGSGIVVVAIKQSPYSFVNDVSGLVFYYKLDSGDVTNNTVYDYAQGAYDASLSSYSSSSVSTISTTTYAIGSGSLSFTYSNKQQMLMNQNFYPSIVGMSISFWMYDGDGSAYARVFQFMTYSSQTSYLINFVKNSATGSNTWRCYVYGTTNYLSTASTLTTNTWYHITITLTSAGAIKIYVNGSLNNSGTVTYPATSTYYNYNWLSRSWDTDSAAGNGFFNGYIDDFRFYNGVVLSSSQITQIYNEASYTTRTTMSSTSISTVDSSSVLITWAGTNTYYISVYENTTGTTYGTNGNTIASSPYTINGLSSGTTYKFYVIPYDNLLQQGTPSQLLSVTTKSSVPTQTYLSSYQPDIMWFTFSDTTNYSSSSTVGSASLSNTTYLGQVLNSKIVFYTYNSSNAQFYFPSFTSNYYGYTICFWLQASMNGSGGSIFRFASSNGSYISCSVGGSSSTISFTVYNATRGTTYTNSCSYNTSFNHIAFTITFTSTSAATYSLYLNSVLQSSSSGASFDGSLTYSNSLSYISCNNIGTNAFYIGDFRFFNSIATQTNVTYIYGTYNSTNSVVTYTSVTAIPLYSATNTINSFTSDSKTVSGITGTYSYTNGSYVCLASSSGEGTYAYYAANKDTTNFWHCCYMGELNKYGSGYSQHPYSNGTYVGGGSGLYWTTTVSSTSIAGEWIQYKLPYKLYLSSYGIYNRSGGGSGRFPGTFYIAGSNDGSTWYVVDSRNNTTDYGDTETIFTLSSTSTTGYYYFRLIVSSLAGSGNVVNLKQFNLYGYK